MAGSLRQAQRHDDGCAPPGQGSLESAVRLRFSDRHDLVDLATIDPHVGHQGSLRIDDERALGAEQPPGPSGGFFRQLLARGAEDQQVLDGGPQLGLLPHPPDAPEQSRRSEAHVDHRHDGQRDELRDDDRKWTLKGRAAKDVDHQDRDQDRKAEAERSHASLLDAGHPATREPEPDDGLTGEDRPGHDDLQPDGGHDRAIGICQDGDRSSTDQAAHDQERSCRLQGAFAERKEGVAEPEHEVTGDLERDHR